MYKKIFIFLTILLLVTSGALLWYQGIIGNGDRHLLRSIKDKPELVALYNKAKAKEKDIAKNPDEASLYFDLGLEWKSIAELTASNQKEFFTKSLGVYENGIERFGQKNILFYLNAGKLAERIGAFEKAEGYYKKAIEISPADESGYLYLVDLYYYSMHKSEASILAVFDAGLKIMVSPIALTSGRATYLRRAGSYVLALKDYELLSKNFPNNMGYKEIIQELKQKIAIQK